MAKEKNFTKSTRSLSGGGKVQGSKTSKIPLNKHTKATKVTKKTSSAVKTDRPSTDNIFGRHLPSSRLRLPSTGNVSAAEQIILLTETIRSHDPLNRLIQNRMDTATLTFMINQSRTFPKYPLKNNSLGKSLQITMREWGHAGWTVSKHKSGNFKDFKPAANDLTLSNMQLQCQDFPEKKGQVQGLIDSVLFEALAIDVTRLPDGDDALDLTRCVLFALHNPNSGLKYPRDFGWLAYHIGGPLPVTRANQDQLVFVRWHEAHKAHKKAVNKA